MSSFDLFTMDETIKLHEGKIVVRELGEGHKIYFMRESKYHELMEKVNESKKNEVKKE